MKVLVIEDRGATSQYLVEALRARGYVVYEAGWIYDASSYWSRFRPECLIVDLNMVPNGLKEREVEETQEGLLTGWIWLKYYVFSVDATARQRTLVYTRYVKEFTGSVPEEERAGVTVISKTAERAAASVLSFVKKVGRELRENDCQWP